MVDHDAPSDPSGRMDIDTEDLGRAHLDEIGHVLPVIGPKPMGKPVGLKGLKTLEEKEGLYQAMACRVAIEDREHIRPRRLAEARIRTMCGKRQVAQDRFRHLGRTELHRDPRRQRLFECLVVENSRMDERPHQGLVRDHLIRFGANPVPDRINRRQFLIDLSHMRALRFRGAPHMTVSYGQIKREIRKLNEDARGKLRLIIEARIAELQAASLDTKDSRAAVELDQQSVGRLSRMDAMQHQAMAKAQEARRQTEIEGLRKALANLDGEDFGYCADCGDEISIERLIQNPRLVLCAACIRDMA